jgi:tRNA(Ile2) C34 agmatinyltransferase TiaS
MSGYLNEDMLDVEVEPEVQEPPACPICHAPSVYMGALGWKDWFRCRYCGNEHSVHREVTE